MGMIAKPDIDRFWKYVTKDQCSPEEESTGLLISVFRNGKILIVTTLAEIRERVTKGE